MRIGMVGAGFIGQLAHLMNYVEVLGCRVVGLAEFRPSLRAEVCRRYGIPIACETHHELVSRDDVDAVVVVTPRPMTASTVADCLRAGKHVMSEKPMAGTSSRARELVACAEENGVLYGVGYMKRCDEGVLYAKRTLHALLASGELGPVMMVRAHCTMGNSYCRADGHVTTSETAIYPTGGEIMYPAWMNEERGRLFARYVNCFSHNTNLLRFLFEQTPQVEYARVSDLGGQIVILDFGKFRAVLETADVTNRGWDEVTEITFAHGKLIIKTPPPLLKNVAAQVEIIRGGEVQEMLSPQLDWTWSFRRQAQAFVEAIRDRKPLPSPGSDAVHDLELIEAIWQKDEGLAKGRGVL